MEQYKDAAVRHYADALALREHGRKDNSGHLLGFSAECAIKQEISSVSADGSSPRGHLPDFLCIARKHINKRSSMHDLLQRSLLAGWKVERRYFGSGHTTDAELDEWIKDTRRLLGAAGIKVRQ
jgi:hypothetical protein